MNQKLAITAVFLLAAATIVLAAPKNRQPQGKSFYLTTTLHDGLNAPFACADGYHMANIYEIFDPTGLRYDMTLGAVADDSGSGPPAGPDFKGWVRGGQNASGDATLPPFGPNCQAFQSNDSQVSGNQVSLSTAGPFVPWQITQLDGCDVPAPVWCVSD